MILGLFDDEIQVPLQIVVLREGEYFRTRVCADRRERNTRMFETTGSPVPRSKESINFELECDACGAVDTYNLTKGAEQSLQRGSAP